MNLIIMGSGAMGKAVAEMVKESEDAVLVGMVEPLKSESLVDMPKADVIIDFSHPDNILEISNYAKKNNAAVVIATTGYDMEQLVMIKELSEHVPVVLSSNYSFGILALKMILPIITETLEENFDIEIIEKHHNKKLDAPSGTAITLAGTVDPTCKYEWIYGRKGNARRGKEIGIHSMRGGSIVGEHIVIFSGQDEVIEIKHTATSKKIFAAGALKAAKIAITKEPNFYTLEELVR